MRTALAAAKAVYENNQALQSEVNEAVKSLTFKIAEARLLGDVDGDGQITTNDTVEILRAAAEIATLSAEDAASADVNGDGVADTADAVLVLYVYADYMNADKHSPASSARSTKRWVRGMLMSVGVESSH